MAIISKNKITPFLWFKNEAEDAMKFYCKVFKNSKIIGTNIGPNKAFFGGSFEIEGQRFNVLNMAHSNALTENISFFVSCKTQKEVDYYWSKLTADGGKESRCGWLKDKFGISWQIIPDDLMKLMSDKNPTKANAVMQAMLKKNKIIIKDLKKAHSGK
jgi:predicted 3-demethylubiquinone-9 3-methyltransferase (glyoxalase superfamily)